MLKAIVVENVRLNPSRMRVSVSSLFLKKYFSGYYQNDRIRGWYWQKNEGGRDLWPVNKAFDWGAGKYVPRAHYYYKSWCEMGTDVAYSIQWGNYSSLSQCS